MNWLISIARRLLCQTIRVFVFVSIGSLCIWVESPRKMLPHLAHTIKNLSSRWTIEIQSRPTNAQAKMMNRWKRIVMSFPCIDGVALWISLSISTLDRLSVCAFFFLWPKAVLFEMPIAWWRSPTANRMFRIWATRIHPLFKIFRNYLLLTWFAEASSQCILLIRSRSHCKHTRTMCICGRQLGTNAQSFSSVFLGE